MSFPDLELDLTTQQGSGTLAAQLQEPSWQRVLQPEFEEPYFAKLERFVRGERERFLVFPPEELVLNALNQTPFDRVKVVILGQDPYLQPGQAMGMSFSVPDGVPLPPSLKNIYQELKSDLGIAMGQSGNLLPWAKQGVLLINAILTVRQGEPGSHQKQGWERLTDVMIERLNKERQGVVFMLWGSYAQAKGKMIDSGRHLVLKAGHPSPLSVKRFRGCRHFSQANHYLRQTGQTEINWRLN